MNRCIFLGRMTKEPEIRYSNGEKSIAIARFSFAVDRRGPKDDEPTADFINCTAFDRKAELLERYGKQGLKLLLTGRMQNNNYTNKEGQKVYGMQLVVDDLEFAESKKASEGSENSQGQQPPDQSQAAQPARPTQTSSASSSSSQTGKNSSKGNQKNAIQGGSFMNLDSGMDDGDLPFN